MEKPSEINKSGCKELLVWRMFTAIALSIFFQFLLMSVVILLSNSNIINPLLWFQNTWNVVFSFRMWCYFLLLATVTFLQGFMCIKDYLSPPRYLSNRFFIFCSMLGPRNVLLCSLYVAVGGILTWLHLSLEEGSYTSFSKPCKMTEGYCFVEEYYFLLLGMNLFIFNTNHEQCTGIIIILCYIYYIFRRILEWLVLFHTIKFLWCSAFAVSHNSTNKIFASKKSNLRVAATSYDECNLASTLFHRILLSFWSIR